MKPHRLLLVSIIAFALPACLPVRAEDGLILRVTAGKADVTDWVAHTTLDLATAGDILDIDVSAERIGVVELDASGRAAPVVSQVDSTGAAGIYSIAWRVPGKLAAGVTRTFRVLFQDAGEPDADSGAITVTETANLATVTNGDIVLEHSRSHGGMITRVGVGGADAKLTWNDKIYDGSVYYLAHRPADKFQVTADGPLRVAIRTEGIFGAPSNPRATYTFTSYAGLPFTMVEADVTQDFAHQWISLHFVEMQIGAAGFTHFATDTSSGALKHAGGFKSGSDWAAVLNNDVLIATTASHSPGVWDGGGQTYGAYLRSGVSRMASTHMPWRCAIVFGPGPQALRDETVQRWSKILADPPRVSVALDKLELRVARLAQALRERTAALERLTGEVWVQTYVAVTLARRQAEIARERHQSGALRDSLDALRAGEDALNVDAGQAELQSAGKLHAGIVRGHPFLANDKVAYLWSRPEEGAGLFSIFDRVHGRELLKIQSSEAPFWEIAAKSAESGESRKSLGTPCEVTCDLRDGEGLISFRWRQGLEVVVAARLQADASLLRLRLAANCTTESTGLLSVTFPVVAGLSPITENAEDDTILEASGMGWLKPSPLTTGKASSATYPQCLQFTALLGDGRGLYFAEEDGDANRKSFSWTPAAQARTLTFSITHPVLNWGADQPVKGYESPGDIVLGPFDGDWYDAARIYREWALTAPWCAKGPVYEREDYPKWLIKAPYWTIAHLGDEGGIQSEIDKQAFYGVPTMIAHTYSYYIMAHQDDRYPEHWPPKLGSKGFKQAVRQLQDLGIRIVPYIQGWLWDEDTESYRTKDALNNAALFVSRSGAVLCHTSYGYGQRLTGMCPASRLWRDEMLDMVRELVGRYGVDGVYFDFLTMHGNDCHNTKHGHPICGGNYWTQAVHGLYEECRALAKELNPEALVTGESAAEFCIDVQDIFYVGGTTDTNAPVFQAVYHGYVTFYGADMNKLKTLFLGRPWLLGFQNGWHNTEAHMIGTPPNEAYAFLGAYYRRLLKCRWEFGAPYLGYGEMLRPPKITGDLPGITEKGGHGDFTVPAVEGSAWKAPDGSAGIFFLNYDEQNAHSFTWTADLAEVAGLDAAKRIKISRWTPDAGLVPLFEGNGGVVSQALEAQPLDIIALKVEEAQ